MNLTVSADGHLTWNGRQLTCALGRSGLRHDKVEGDGATPIGSFALKTVYYRADRLAAAPITRLPVIATRPDMGWCDDPDHADYNRPVQLPHPARCEALWRDDGVYDVVVVLGHNDDPPIPNLGSAIFLHVVRPGWEPTEGCVALPLADLLAVLADCGPGDRLEVTPP